VKEVLKKMRYFGLVSVLICAVLLAGCGAKEEPLPEKEGPGQQTATEETQKPERPQEEEKQPEELVPEKPVMPEEEVDESEGTVPPTVKPEQKPQPEPEKPETGFSFADVADREFYFSSGAGAWRTVLYIHEDGTFDGVFQDSDMGDMGEDYPNGTVYYSEFSGTFSQPKMIDAQTYQFRMESITYANDFGEELVDGFRYVYGEAYGIQGAEVLHLYLPNTPIADLPEAYRTWVGYYNEDSMQETTLPFYGLYNVTEQNGFSSYLYRDPVKEIKTDIAEAESKAAKLEEALQEAVTQTDMNLLSSEIYQVWDDVLNRVWGILKNGVLDAETMEALTEEQLRWITEKEAAMQEAGAEYEGGSMYALVVNNKAAELTRLRVYELAEYLP